VTERQFWAAGLAWMRDGRSILYGSSIAPDGGLMRVRADGPSPPERVDLAGSEVGWPAVARTQERLAFHRLRWNPDIYHLPLGGSPSPLIASTFPDIYPQYSPDGRRIAFQSGRGGEGANIWLANADGSDPTRLTRGPGRDQGSPRWSPDGRSIAFDSRGEDGRFDVWTIGADGSGLRQVTRDPADDTMASWSRDGRLLYLTSNRTGRDEVWRVALEGGSEEQVTHDGGCIRVESFDGRTLYYMRTCQTSALLARPTAGGEERTIFRCVDLRSFAVGAGGVFHVDCVSPGASRSPQRVVRYWDAITNQDRPVGAFEAAWTGGLSVAPDGKSLVYSGGPMGSDLMMIENFR
jgi:hypothetical protein